LSGQRFSNLNKWHAEARRRKIERAPLETGSGFSSFLVCRKQRPERPWGSAKTDAGSFRHLLVPILLNGGFGYENDIEFRSPLAIGQ
jgi:hypothetical protein